MIISQANRVIYNGYQTVSTSGCVYNSAGESGAEDGWINSQYDDVYLQVAIGTLTSSKLLYQVEGRFDGLNRPVKLYNASVTAATDDALVTISEKVKEIRVGVKVDAVASPLIADNKFYCGVVLSERS